MFSISASEPTAKVGYEGVEAPDFDESLVAAFERVAATFPIAHRPRFRRVGADLSELNETANRLAHRLIACGVCLRRSRRNPDVA